jgi:hypothetical protein
MARWTNTDLKVALNRTASRSKYSNQKVTVDGISFDSKKEAARYNELRAMLQAGLIHSLKVHPVFPIVYQETRICDVELDFAYTTCDKRFPSLQGVRVFEDVKSAGTNTPMSRLKRKLVEAFYPEVHVELV